MYNLSTELPIDNFLLGITNFGNFTVVRPGLQRIDETSPYVTTMRQELARRGYSWADKFFLAHYPSGAVSLCHWEERPRPDFTGVYLELEALRPKARFPMLRFVLHRCRSLEAQIADMKKRDIEKQLEERAAAQETRDMRKDYINYYNQYGRKFGEHNLGNAIFPSIAPFVSSREAKSDGSIVERLKRSGRQYFDMKN